MSELSTPDTYIKDPVLAEEVAYSAKDLRSGAAAIRLVDSLAKEAKTLESTDFKGKAEHSGKLMGAYAVYPEVFVKAFGKSDKKQDSLSENALTSAIAKITNDGYLPLGEWGGRGYAGGLDKKADVIETVTEALILHPPSQDFLRDNKLGQEQYLGSMQKGYRWVVSVENVAGQLDWWESLDKEVDGVERDVQGVLKAYDQLTANSPDNTGATKLSLILSAFDKVAVYAFVDGHTDLKKDFEAKTKAAKNSDTTTIAGLKDLYVEGAEAVLELIKSTRDKHLATYQAVVSGDAAKYKSPGTAEKQD